MPKFPDINPQVLNMSGSTFEKFRHKMKAKGDDLIRLHLGDTYQSVAYSLPIDPSFLEKYPGWNRYCDTFGITPLREALVEKLKKDNQIETKIENIMMTGGAVNALNVAASTLFNVNDDVLVLTPVWPLLLNIIRLVGANLIEAPFYVRLYDEPNLDIQELLNQYITPKTCAIYLNSPNNPSGKVLSRNQLQQIADFAKEHRLWIITDEAYDGLVFDDHTHISIATLPGMADQTLSVFTFAKSFMFAGLRLGYVVGNADIIKNMNKIMVHQIYNPPTIGQYLMIEPVKTRHQWLPGVRKHYQDLRDMFIENLSINVNQPEGTYFLFFSVKDYLKGREEWQFVEACIENGVAAAPGRDFGKDFDEYIRLCFTGESPDRLKIGLARINEMFVS